MIGALLRTSWLSIRRDPIVLGLNFALPIVFFSIFAFIFGGPSKGAQPALDVGLVDEDKSALSGRYVEAIGALEALTVVTSGASGPWDREAAQAALKGGEVSAVVVLPAGFGDALGRSKDAAKPAELIYDSANPMARFMVAGLLQSAAMSAAPGTLVARGLDELAAMGAPATDAQRAAATKIQPAPHGGEVVSVEARDLRGKSQSTAAYYAAGIAVMFLLFSMAGAGGALLSEEESGTLERILSSNATMDTLLIAYFLFFVILGFAQIVWMFLFGAVAFGIELFVPQRLVGFLAITAVSACAAAGFGMLLATLCRTRQQLSGISTLVILLMSALGGSMVPRFVMPPIMSKVALFTFNGWAIDGYLKVFWYDDPAAGVAGTLTSLLPELGVLATMTVVCLILARRFARRWDAT